MKHTTVIHEGQNILPAMRADYQHFLESLTISYSLKDLQKMASASAPSNTYARYGVTNANYFNGLNKIIKLKGGE